MSEAVDQADENAVATDHIEDTTTDARETDAGNTDTLDTDIGEDTDALTDEGKTTETERETLKESGKKSTEYDVSTKRNVRGKRKKKSAMQKLWEKECRERRWTCDDMPYWRVYMKSYVEEEKRLEKEDRLKHRMPADLPKFPRINSDEQITSYKSLPLNAFQLENQTSLPNKLNRDEMIRIWKNMRTNMSPHVSESEIVSNLEVSQTEGEKWPSVWPCTTRDLVSELRERHRRTRRKRRDIFPCDPQDDGGPVFDEPKENFANRKELGHARIPATCRDVKKDLLVDRAAGEHPGLVDGDYIIFELSSKTKGYRVYADVCLRGLKGMHLLELAPLRWRQKTWKFCFYQAVVALLAKTQLRYKYAWSANIDYIYDHAWTLFTHIGAINVKDKQRLDDIVVYNYKYSVELELVQELKDVPIVKDISWQYEERNLKRKVVLERKELMTVRLEIGSEKITDEQTGPVHRSIKKIEDWFDKLALRYRNCIIRTPRFSLAFWRDGFFWYLYNPYRCDEFGYWNDTGYACILKFCTKESLKRHIMILLLRAYAYTVPKSQIQISENYHTVASNENPPDISEDKKTDKTPAEESFFTIQIFNMIYHCCQIHNLKLLERGPPKPPKRLANRKTIDDCPFDPLDFRDPCSIEQDEGDLKEAIEKPTWLKLYKITWAKCTPNTQKKKANKDVSGTGKMRWHQYIVEESNKLFSLWGEIHITDSMFDKENRGMQTYACYVVCAGMTRIMAPEYWSSKTLDVIVMCGDRYYTHSKLEAEFKSTRNEYRHVSCWNRYLMSHFKIGETMFEANVLPAICGRLYSRSSKHLWQSLEQMFLKYHFGILTCESSCLGVFKFCGGYYMCDVNSFGPPLFPYGEGAVYLIRATYFYKFITVLILTIGSPECSQFALNPVEILRVIDVGPANYTAGKIDNVAGVKGTGKSECPYDEEKKKQMKKWKHRRVEAARTIDKTCCKGNE